jgi:1,4-dihydroxy-2-naphthoate octaprenyltransferase
MGWLARWLYALKPASWPKLLVPAFLGQALGAATAGGLSWAGACLGSAFTVADLVFVVLMNDWGDQEVDALKRRMFPTGCSPKTIPDGILSARAVLGGGLVAGGSALGLAWGGGLILERPLLGWLGVACLALFWAYTLPPLRLNYRGGGEVLEALGVGLLLPALHVYVQAGHLSGSTLVVLGGFVPLCGASALASGLADEQSDRAGGKTTCATWLGNRVTRRGVEGSCWLGAALWLGAGLGAQAGLVGGLPAWALLPPAILVAVSAWRLGRSSEGASTGSFAAIRDYKQVLHQAIWHGGALLGALALAATLLP